MCKIFIVRCIRLIYCALIKMNIVNYPFLNPIVFWFRIFQLVRTLLILCITAFKNILLLKLLFICEQ